MANRHMKGSSLSLIITEMPNKTRDTISHLSEWPSPINQQTSISKNVEKKELSFIVGRNADWCSHCEKQYRATSRKLKMELFMTQHFHFWEYIQRNLKHEFKRIYVPLG